MNSDHKNDVKKFWDERAGLKDLAGSNDFILKDIEIQAIKKHIKDNQRVLEIGCGSGGTAIELAKTCIVDILALDYSQGMIDAACEALSQQKQLAGSVRFQSGDLRSLGDLGGPFDVAFTERTLINLETWEEQQAAIQGIVDTLKPKGRYLMCENSFEGLERINAFRSACKLEAISPPWHNRYLKERELKTLKLANARLVNVEHISSSYYFVSRVVNAWLAKQEGIEPKYDAPVNRLGMILPPLDDLGQTKIWVFEKE